MKKLVTVLTQRIIEKFRNAKPGTVLPSNADLGHYPKPLAIGASFTIDFI